MGGWWVETRHGSQENLRLFKGKLRETEAKARVRETDPDVR